MASPRAFLEACQAAGYPYTHDHNHPESTGVGFLVLNRIDEIRMSTAVTYLQMARDRMNLTVRSGVLVHRVLIENGRAVGVEVESGSEIYRVESDLCHLERGCDQLASVADAFRCWAPRNICRSGVSPWWRMFRESGRICEIILRFS